MIDNREKSRQNKLNEAQEKHSELTRTKNAIKRRMAQDMNEISLINKALKELGTKIYDLKNIDGDTPHVTDHAVVRYLERVKGMNIWDIKAEIMLSTEAVRVDNVIVTINGGEKDDPSRVKL